VVAVPVLKFAPAAALIGRCVFCRAFVTLGGCFGPTRALNKAMLDRRWDEARRVAAEQPERLRSLSFESLPGRETAH
jgi:hypothetical protein